MNMLDWEIFKVGHCKQLEKLSCRSAPLHICRFPALVCLITHPVEGHLIFDTGYSHNFLKETKHFPERAYRLATPVTLGEHENLASQLTHRGIEIGDVKSVVLSHFHADHIAGIVDFPEATIFSAQEGFQEIHRYGRIAGVRRGLLPKLLPKNFENRSIFFESLPVVTLPQDYHPFEQGFDLFGDGSVLAIALPGHSVGQYGLAFKNAEGQSVFLVADASWSTGAIRDFTLPPAITNHLLHHSKAYPETLGKLHELYQRNPEILIIPAHCREKQQQLVKGV